MATRPRTRKIGRLSEIAQVAVRHGFGYFFERHKLNRPPSLDDAGGSGTAAAVSDRAGRHLREMLDELGPTFVKFGQLLSTRPDIVRSDIVTKLQQHPDDVRPVPVRRRSRTSSRRRARHRRSSGAFVRFDEVPIAAASIGQVHCREARAEREEEVVVEESSARMHRVRSKVRPGTALPGHADQGRGARPGIRLHRFGTRAGRRVRTVHPGGARLQGSGRATPRPFRRNFEGDGLVASPEGHTATTRSCAC